MQSKVSSEKNSISINLGSIMERDEKRLEYRFCCSSKENTGEEMDFRGSISGYLEITFSVEKETGTNQTCTGSEISFTHMVGH